MAQHDYVIADQSGLSFLSDLNSVLAATVTQNSGPIEPSPTYAYQPWADTTTGLMKVRNASNTAWVPQHRLDGAFSLVPPADGAVTTARLADGALAASTAGLLKMADGYLAASTAGRAKMADGFVDTAKLLDGGVTPAKLSQRLTQVAAVTASGTAVDFTGIPSWVKRLTVAFGGLSLSGTAHVLFQLGDSGGPETTGYISSSNFLQGATSSAAISNTSGIVAFAGAASNVISGAVQFINTSGNYWIAAGQYNFTSPTGVTGWTGGDKTLSTTLDRIRVTTTGADTFDAGSVGIFYEG